jgi:hypothetical protein
VPAPDLLPAYVPGTAAGPGATAGMVCAGGGGGGP